MNRFTAFRVAPVRRVSEKFRGMGPLSFRLLLASPPPATAPKPALQARNLDYWQINCLVLETGSRRLSIHGLTRISESQSDLGWICLSFP